jgi:predicted DNA-binding transcriptional regulator AlpA
MSQTAQDASTVLDEVMYAPEELTAMLKLAPGTLANMRSKGTGPRFIKLGHSRIAPVRYPRREVLAWLAEHNPDAPLYLA